MALAREDFPYLSYSIFSLPPIILDDNQHLYYNQVHPKVVHNIPNLPPHHIPEDPYIMSEPEDWGITDSQDLVLDAFHQRQGGYNVSGLHKH